MIAVDKTEKQDCTWIFLILKPKMIHEYPENFLRVFD